MDEVFRGHRIAIRLIDGHHVARITETSGKLVPITTQVPLREGPELCMERAKVMLLRYLDYMR